MLRVRPIGINGMDSTTRFIVVIIVLGIPAILILWGMTNVLFGTAYDVGEMSVGGWLFVATGFITYVLELIAYTLLKKEGYFE